MATKKTKKAVVPRIVALDENFNELEGVFAESGNVRAIMKYGSVDVYVDEFNPNMLVVVPAYDSFGTHDLALTPNEGGDGFTLRFVRRDLL